MRTVGDPLRLELVRLLADDREWACSELQARLGLPASTGSYHLRLLREAGVTRTRAEGTQRRISLRRADLEARFPGLVDVLTPLRAGEGTRTPGLRFTRALLYQLSYSGTGLRV